MREAAWAEELVRLERADGHLTPRPLVPSMTVVVVRGDDLVHEVVERAHVGRAEGAEVASHHGDGTHRGNIVYVRELLLVAVHVLRRG